MDTYIISFALSFFISLTLILFFRKMDKNNIQITKVKKYLDNAKGELETFAQDREKAFKSNSVEMDQLLDKSKSVIEFINNQLDNVDRKVEMLNSSNSTIKKVQGQLDQVNQLAKTVNDNVKVIQNDEHEIKKLANRVGFIKKSLLEVEKKIPQVEQDILSRSDEKIRHIEDQYHTNLKTLNQAVEDKIKAMIESFSERMDEIYLQNHEQFDLYKNELHEMKNHLVTLEDEMIDKSKANINLKIQESSKRMDLMNGNLARLEGEMYRIRDQILNETNDRYNEFSNKINEGINNIGANQRLFSDNMNTIENQFKHTLEQYISDVHNRIESFSDVFSKIDKTAIEIEEKILRELDIKVINISEKANSKIEILRDNLKVAESQIEEFMKNSHLRLEKDTEGLKNVLEEEKKSVFRKVQDVQNNLDFFFNSTKERLNKEIENLGQMVEEEKQKVSRGTKLAANSLDSFINEQKDKISKELQNVEMKLGEDTNIFDRSIEEMRASTEGMLDVLRDNLSKQINNTRIKAEDGIKEIWKNMENLKSSLDSFSNTQRDRVKKEVEELHDRIEFEKKDSQQSYELLKSNIDHLTSLSKERITKEMDDMMSIVNEKKIQVSQFFDQYKLEIGDRNTEMDQILNGLKDHYTMDLNRLMDRMKSSFEKSETDFVTKNAQILKDTQMKVQEVNNQLESVKSNFNYIAEKSFDELNIRIKDTKVDINRSIDMFEKSIKDKEVQVISHLNSRSDDFSKKLIDLDDKLHRIKDQIENNLNISTDQFKDHFRSIEQSILNKLTDRTDVITMRITSADDKISNLKETIKALGDQSQEEIRISCKRIENEYENRISQQINDVEHKIVSLNEDVKNLRETSLSTEDVVRKMEEEEKKFDSYFSRKQKEFTHLSDTKITDIKRFIQTMEKDIQSIRDKETDRTRSEMEKLVQEIHILEERVETFEKNTKIFRRGDKLSEKLSQEMNQVEDQLKRLREEKDLFVDFEKRIKNLSKERDMIINELSRLESRKGELSYLTNRLTEMIALSDESEGKLSKISRDIVQVEQVEEKINRLNKVYTDLSDKIKVLTSQDKEINDAVNMLKKTDSFITNLDGRIEDVREEYNHINSLNEKVKKELRDIEFRIASLEESDEKIEIIVKRFKQMDSFAMDVEKRIEQMEIARRRLTETEVKMSKLQDQADDKINRLSSLVGSSILEKEPALTSVAAKGNSSSSIPGNGSGRALDMDSKRESVLKLYDRGFDIERISTLLNMSKSEVKLIIDFDRS